MSLEMFPQTRFQPILAGGEPIKIKVIQAYPRNCIRFNQGVGRTLDMPGHTQRPQQRTNQAGFSGAKFALQLDVQPVLVCSGIAVLVRGK